MLVGLFSTFKNQLCQASRNFLATLAASKLLKSDTKFGWTTASGLALKDLPNPAGGESTGFDGSPRFPLSNYGMWL